jgi:hypothetical protein
MLSWAVPMVGFVAEVAVCALALENPTTKVVLL